MSQAEMSYMKKKLYLFACKYAFFFNKSFAYSAKSYNEKSTPTRYTFVFHFMSQIAFFNWAEESQ